MGMEPYLKDGHDGVEIRIHVQSRASKTEIVGVQGEALKIRVKASPVEGKANQELCRFLAHQLGCVQQQVQIVGGFSSRQKRVLIRCKVLQEIREVLLPLLPKSQL